jgi:hypothetical protein
MLESIVLPRSVEVLAPDCFRASQRLQQFIIEDNSQLAYIYCNAFTGCTSLHSIYIPSHVHSIDGDAFLCSGIQEIRISEGNDHFRVSGGFLESFDGIFLYHYFGRDSIVRIPSEIEVICARAFSMYRDFSGVYFEHDSKLRRIDAWVFMFCHSLHSICIPSRVDSIDGRAFSRSGIREIRIAEGNHHLRMSGDFLESFDGKFLYQYFGRNFSVQIPSEIEVICGLAFSNSCSLSQVFFGHDSKLRRIDAWGFAHCCMLQRIYVPSHVESIDGSAFSSTEIYAIGISQGNRHFRVSGMFLLETDGSSLIRYLGSDSDVTVIAEIRSLSAWSFPSIQRLAFERDSQLRRIDARAFSQCFELRAICIPSSVEAIDGSAFADSGICEVTVAEGNVHFRVCGGFLVSYEGRSLIRYFGGDAIVRISNEIEFFSRGSFDSHRQLRCLEFYGFSKVRLIEARAFRACRLLSSISLPASTEFLEARCFMKCEHLREVQFDAGSKLQVIERESFKGCKSLELVSLPKSLEGREGLDLIGVSSFELFWY